MLLEPKATRELLSQFFSPTRYPQNKYLTNQERTRSTVGCGDSKPHQREMFTAIHSSVQRWAQSTVVHSLVDFSGRNICQLVSFLIRPDDSSFLLE